MLYFDGGFAAAIFPQPSKGHSAYILELEGEAIHAINPLEWNHLAWHGWISLRFFELERFLFSSYPKVTKAVGLLKHSPHISFLTVIYLNKFPIYALTEWILKIFLQIKLPGGNSKKEKKKS